MDINDMDGTTGSITRSSSKQWKAAKAEHKLDINVTLSDVISRPIMLYNVAFSRDPFQLSERCFKAEYNVQTIMECVSLGCKKRIEYGITTSLFQSVCFGTIQELLRSRSVAMQQ